jgi:hypothetical protein
MPSEGPDRTSSCASVQAGGKALKPLKKVAARAAAEVGLGGGGTAEGAASVRLRIKLWIAGCTCTGILMRLHL